MRKVRRLRPYGRRRPVSGFSTWRCCSPSCRRSKEVHTHRPYPITQCICTGARCSTSLVQTAHFTLLSPNWPNPVSAYLHQFFNDVSPLFQWSPLAWANNNSLAVLVFALNYSPLPCDDETSPFFAMHYASCITYASSATLLPAKFNDMHRSTYSQSRCLSSQCISTSSLCRHLHHSHRNGEALDRRRHARMPPAQRRVSQQEWPRPPIVISLAACLNVRPYAA